jgi:hypothetical protein
LTLSGRARALAAVDSSRSESNIPTNGRQHARRWASVATSAAGFVARAPASDARRFFVAVSLLFSSSALFLLFLWNDLLAHNNRLGRALPRKGQATFIKSNGFGCACLKAGGQAKMISSLARSQLSKLVGRHGHRPL